MGTSNRELCLSLLRCETEEEVITLLQREGFWDNRLLWKPYGNISNNRGIVGNQQSSPVAALVEKIVNSIDAVLIAECRRAGIEPSSPDAPRTMQEAVERFLGIREGRVQNLDPGSRTRYADHIHLVACGSKEQPGYMIVDNGEGQAPDEFADTLLSLLRENKTAIPFVQGKFNMGGTGVLQFAGTHSFQLVISRRQADLPAKPSARRNHWGFTLLRRLDPGPLQPQTMYVYLAPSGDVPSFDAEDLPVLPGARYPDAYVGRLSAGTCIKLWNYKLPGKLKTIATLDLRYALERHLPEPALPVRIHERRPGYRAHSYDTTMAGLCSVLADDKGHVEAGMDTGGPMEVGGVGTVAIRVVVMKEPEEEGHAGAERYAGGIFFNVNGQLHSELGSEFIARRTKYDYIAKDMIVILDCTSLPQRVREDLFLASRDRMRQCHERAALEDSVIDYLKDHPGLRELNARRREARLSSRSEDDTASIIQTLVRADPSLAQIFGRGQNVRLPVGPIPEPEPYAGKHFPTFFRIAREPKNGLTKHCPRNQTCRVTFETDAENDYFSRPIDPGRLAVRGMPSRVGAVHLWNGQATLRFSPPAASSPGDQLRVEVTISDVSRSIPFESSFLIVVEQEAPSAPPGEPSPPRGATLTGMPNIVEVYQESWALHGFNEISALELKHGENDVIDMYVNMDNLHLRNEIARRRSLQPELLRYWFKYGLCLLALGMLFQRRQSHEGTSGQAGGEAAEEDESRGFSHIASSCRGLAVTIVPVIAQLGHGKI